MIEIKKHGKNAMLRGIDDAQGDAAPQKYTDRRFTAPDRKRAAQFMPFNGLRGYTEQATAAKIRRAARREITEDRARALNDALLELEKGNTVAITYFTGNGYACTHTTIVEVDPVYRRLRTEDGIIRFKDWDVVCE